LATLTINMSDSIIQVHHLIKNFGEGDSETKVLRGMDLTINPGEFVIVFGPSGSGKSTLLNIINGLELPTSGQIIVDGQDITSLDEDARARFHQDKIGMVFQAYNLISSLTVQQNITLPLVFSKRPHAEREAVARQLLADFELEYLADRLPSEISGGQQQRVGIMRALINQPPIIIADEPTGNLDSVATDSVMSLFTRLNKNYQNTLIVVTHDQSLFKYADRVIHILDGEVVKETVGHAVKPRLHQVATVFEQALNNVKDLKKRRYLQLLASLLSKQQLSSFDQQELTATLTFIDQFVTGKLNLTEFYQKLDDPVSEGGAGLYRTTARHLAVNLSNILETLK
jgi:putative ABC transport system ATP-binding protein